eukprot:CAMPEP_0203758548 /NCGR_PEP_ID=MMETSP0098-20131031/11398_1 /ASSEMBLY_ACC=CAM_ASM_000208 /TAXON_ID=96639 /ORGANISM=" , Strain NY0313808BC1" /LENGTH=2591 /DNA_ID=CAMNT_0050651051 /DNA_START=477 /DNA_END=8249 /DNA_ORIENTATION=-
MGSVGLDITLAFRQEIWAGLEDRLKQLDSLWMQRNTDTPSDGILNLDAKYALFNLWDEFPRRSTFFVGMLRQWTRFPDHLLRAVVDNVVIWAKLPFDKGSSSNVVPSNSSHIVTAELVWSKTVADILYHVYRYTRYDVDVQVWHGLATAHMALLNSSEEKDPSYLGLLNSHICAQAQLQWAVIVGELCTRKKSIVHEMLSTPVPITTWQFIDISQVPVGVASEICNKFYAQLNQNKLSNTSKLATLFTLDCLLDRVDFQSLETTQPEWSQVLFRDIILSKIYKKVEALSKKQEVLKVAALNLMTTIVCRSPRAHHEGLVSTFFNKRVIKNIGDPRKVTRSLEIVLRMLRGHQYTRPRIAWDAFLTYSPLVQFRVSPSPYAQPFVPIANRNMDSLFVEIFDKSKSRALACLMGQDGTKQSNNHVTCSFPTINNAATPIINSVNTLSGTVGGLVTAADSQLLTSSNHISFRSGAGGRPSSVRQFSTFGANYSSSLNALPKNLRVCKHIILQIAATEMKLFEARILPLLLSLPEDLYKLMSPQTNRPIVAFRAIWDMYCPGDSAFRSTAIWGSAFLGSTLKKLHRTLPAMLQEFDKAMGTNELGHAEYPLAPTCLWTNTNREQVKEQGQPCVDETGDVRGYTFSWADPTSVRTPCSGTGEATNALINETQALLESQDLYETSIRSVRTRNIDDKIAAELQMYLSARVLQNIFKKRSTHAVEVFRELIYTLPVLACSPVLKDVGDLVPALPGVDLLLHVDWTIAQAVSHAYQIVIRSSRSNTTRLRIFSRLFNAINKSIAPKSACAREVLTYIRQILLLQRLWIHTRQLEARHRDPSDPTTFDKLDDESGEEFFIMSILLMTFPCATVRAHAKEIAECNMLLWPSHEVGKQTLEVINKVQATGSQDKLTCILEEKCPCGSIAPKQRRKTEDDLKAAARRRQHSKPGASPGPPQTSSGSGRSYSVQVPTRSAYNGPNLTSGSCESFQQIFDHSKGNGFVRDELFLWYQSVKSSTAKNIVAATGASLTTVNNPTASASNGTNNGRQAPPIIAPVQSVIVFEASDLSERWDRSIVTVGFQLVEQKTLHKTLFHTSKLLGQWLSKIPKFSESMSSFQLCLRRTATAFAISLAGCEPALQNKSPHSLDPSSTDWPGVVENTIEDIVKGLWDRAKKIAPMTRARAMLRSSLLETLGWSAHPRTIGRFAQLLLEWRQEKMEEIKQAATHTVDTNKKTGLFAFSRSRNVPDSPTSVSSAVLKSEEAAQMSCEVEGITICVLRLSLPDSKSFPGWEFTLKSSFALLSKVVRKELLEVCEWTMSLEFASLVYYCAKCLSVSLVHINDMDELISRADLIWPRADRRLIWTFLQRLAGYDEIKLFRVDKTTVPAHQSQGSSSSPKSHSHHSHSSTVPSGVASFGDYSSHNPTTTAGGSSIAPVTSSSSVGGTGNRGVVSDIDFKVLRDRATRAGAEMLRLGPTSLGTVAPRPDEMLWSWLFYDEDQEIVDESRLLSNYLIAHWHAGDVEAAGGGTFKPFVDRWYQEMEAGNTRYADAIYSSLCNAMDCWLFRSRTVGNFFRPLELQTLAPVAFLSLVQTRVQANQTIRSRAFQLLDVVERSVSSVSSTPVTVVSLHKLFHLGSELVSLTCSSHEKVTRDTALRASSLLAESHPHFASAILAEFAERLPSLVHAGHTVSEGTLEVILPWCELKSTQLEVETGPKYPSEGLAKDVSFSLCELSRVGSSLPGDDLETGSGRTLPEKVSMQQLWVCCSALYDMKLDGGLDLFLPVWRAFALNHASKVINFLLSKIITGTFETNQQVVASFLLSGCTLTIYEKDSQTVLEHLVKVLFGTRLNQISDCSNQRISLWNSDEISDWIEHTLDAQHSCEYSVNQTSEEAEEFKQVLAIKRCVFQSLTLCFGFNRSHCIAALPAMLTFALCSSRLPQSEHLHHYQQQQFQVHNKITPEHRCISVLLISVIHQRGLKYDNDSTRRSRLSNDTLLELSRIPPGGYSDEQLKEVVDAFAELLSHFEPNAEANLNNSWTQHLLWDLLGGQLEQIVQHPGLIVRTLKVFKALRANTPGRELKITYNARGLTQRESTQLEFLALLRVCYWSIEHEIEEITNAAIECMIDVHHSELDISMTKAILNLYASFEEGRTRTLLLELLLLLPVQETDAERVCSRSILTKLRKSITVALLEDNIQNKTLELDLFACFVSSSDSYGMVEFIVTLLPFLFGNFDEESVSILERVILKLPLESSLRGHLDAAFRSRDRQELAQNAFRGLAQTFGPENVASVFMDSCRHYLAVSDTYLFGCFEVCAGLLFCAPVTLEAMVDLISLAFSTQIQQEENLTISRVVSGMYYAQLHKDRTIESDYELTKRTDTGINEIEMVSQIVEEETERILVGRQAICCEKTPVEFDYPTLVSPGPVIPPPECTSGGVASFNSSKHLGAEEEDAMDVVPTTEGDTDPNSTKYEAKLGGEEVSIPAQSESRRKFLQTILATQQSSIENFASQQPVFERSWLDFAFTVAAFKTSSTVFLANEIYGRFIRLDSLDTIDIKPTTRAMIELEIEVLEDCGSSYHCDQFIFDEALEEAYVYLEDHFLGPYT